MTVNDIRNSFRGCPDSFVEYAVGRDELSPENMKGSPRVLGDGKVNMFIILHVHSDFPFVLDHRYQRRTRYCGDCDCGMHMVGSRDLFHLRFISPLTVNS
jgi:hypothetical protein